MYLFFDTETTGLPKNWKAPVSDLNNWPRLVQLAYLIYNENGSLIEKKDYIIKPSGFTIPYESSKVHGITTEKALSLGVSLSSVLTEFISAAKKSNLLIAHNMSFDEKIMGAELFRSKMENIVASSRKMCTMLKTVDYCQIPGTYGYKWPTLQELHKTLFGQGFEDAHNALTDVTVTAKCFFELKRIGVI